MSDFNKPEIINPSMESPVDGFENKTQPIGTAQLENKLAQINQKVEINIQQPQTAAAPIAGGTRKRSKHKKRRKTNKRR